MKFASRVRKGPFLALLIGLQGLFLLESVLPQAVWCHKPDGRIAVEFEAAATPCACHDCERAREANLIERHDHHQSGLLWEAAACVHEPIHSEASKTQSFAPPKNAPAAGPLVLSEPASLPEKTRVVPSIPAESPWFVALDPSPPNASILRC